MSYILDGVSELVKRVNTLYEWAFPNGFNDPTLRVNLIECIRKKYGNEKVTYDVIRREILVPLLLNNNNIILDITLIGGRSGNIERYLFNSLMTVEGLDHAWVGERLRVKDDWYPERAKIINRLLKPLA